MRLARLLYLLAQHPLHLHRELVRRGLTLGWIDRFRPFWDQVRPPSLPITDYASYVWLEYYFSARLREKFTDGKEHFDDKDAQYARLLSYVRRNEMHPLRCLMQAWHLRRCKRVLEFGAGAAPYAHFIKTAWPWTQAVDTCDLPGLLYDFTCRENCGPYAHWCSDARAVFDYEGDSDWDGIVCTEVFEHLPDPVKTAGQMMRSAPLIVFDYVVSSEPQAKYLRATTLALFQDLSYGLLTGPDARGLYVWRRH